MFFKEGFLVFSNDVLYSILLSFLVDKTTLILLLWGCDKNTPP
jgi:hypothetical protein